MALNKAQILPAPGGIGGIGAVSAGTNCTITNGVISANSIVPPVTDILAGSGIGISKNNGKYTISITAFSNTGFPSGTTTVFPQSSAPTGWSTVGGVDNKAIRIANNGGGEGGDRSFTDTFSSFSPSGSVNYSFNGGSGDTNTVSLTPSGIAGGGQTPETGIGGSADMVTGDQLPRHSHLSQERPIDNSGREPYCCRQGGGAWNYQLEFRLDYSGGNQVHVHPIGGPTPFTGRASDHNHRISVNGGSYNASASGNNINLNIRYVDALVCRKN